MNPSRKTTRLQALNPCVQTGRRVKIHSLRGHGIDVDSLTDLNPAQRFSS